MIEDVGLSDKLASVRQPADLGDLQHRAPDELQRSAGVLAGTIIGTLASAILISCATVISYLLGAKDVWIGATLWEVLLSLPGAMLFLTIAGSLFWLFGTAMIGFPVWWLMHYLGLRGRLVAMICGATLVGFVFWLALREWSSPTALHIIASGGLSGAIAGWAFEGAMYRGWCFYKSLRGGEV